MQGQPRRATPAFDPKTYKQCSIVERPINTFREHCAVAIRYDKRGFVWRGTVDVATSRTWLRDPIP